MSTIVHLIYLSFQMWLSAYGYLHCMLALLGPQILKADVVSGKSSCIHYQVSLAQEHAAQKEQFTLTATGIEEAGVGLLSISVTLHFDIPSQPVLHQVCHHYKICQMQCLLANVPSIKSKTAYVDTLYYRKCCYYQLPSYNRKTCFMDDLM